jgi:hypothetical protein
MRPGRTTIDENDSPPPEGCRGGLSRRLKPFFPSQEGIFRESVSECRHYLVSRKKKRVSLIN